jgi:hypothetical protein
VETIADVREFLNVAPPVAMETATEETNETDPAQPLAAPGR